MSHCSEGLPSALRAEEFQNWRDTVGEESNYGDDAPDCALGLLACASWELDRQAPTNARHPARELQPLDASSLRGGRIDA